MQGSEMRNYSYCAGIGIFVIASVLHQRISQPASDFSIFVQKKTLFFCGIITGHAAHSVIHWRSPALVRTYLRRPTELWEQLIEIRDLLTTYRADAGSGIQKQAIGDCVESDRSRRPVAADDVLDDSHVSAGKNTSICKKKIIDFFEK